MMPTQKDDDFEQAQTDLGAESGASMIAGERTCDKCEHYTPALPFSDFLGSCDLEADADKISWNQEGYVAGVYVGQNLDCANWKKKT